MTLQNLVERRFLLLMIATTCGRLGIEISKVMLPVFAARETGSPLYVSIVVFALTAPWLVAGLPAGVLVDRLDRRRLLLLVNVVRATSLGVLFVFALLGQAEYLMVLVTALIVGVGGVFDEPLAISLVPAVTSKDRLERANRWIIAGELLTDPIAQPIGGALIGVGLFVASGTAGVIFLAGAGVLALLRGVFRSPETTTSIALRRDVTEGLRVIWREPVLRSVTFMAGVINGCAVAWLTVFVLFALDPGPLGLSEFEYGLVLAAEGAGSLAGIAAAGRLLDRIGRRWAVGVNIIGNGLMFVTPFLTTNVWLIAVGIAIGGVGAPMWGVVVRSMQQRLAPDNVLGRVSSAYRFFGFGAMALAPLPAGFVAELWGPRVVFLTCGLLTFVLLAYYARTITNAAMAGSGATGESND